MFLLDRFKKIVVNITLSFIYYKSVTYIYNILKYIANIMRHCERPQSLSFPDCKRVGRNEHEETINHDFYHCIFFIIGSAFLCIRFLKIDSSEQAQQTEEAANDQDQQETEAAENVEEPASQMVFPGCFLKLPVTALAEAAPQAGEETPVPVPLPAPSTPLLLTQE